MGRFLTLLSAVGLGFYACTGSPGAGPAATIGALTVSNPYVAEPVTPEVAAVYFSVTNSGESADTLIGLSAEFAARGALHGQLRNGNTIRMVPLVGIELKAGETVVLRAGDRHGMLEDLARPPRRGDTVSVTLRFRDAGSVTVPFPVVGYEEIEERASQALRIAEGRR